MDDRSEGPRLFPLVLICYAVYAALFIYRTSFVVGGVRYFSLFDDAMISMRYGWNLAHGYGLVFNPGGPRVEGYTDPLWMLYMAAIQLLPIPAPKISLVIQVSAALFLLLNLFVVRKIALKVSDGSEPVALGAVILTAAYLPLNNWSLQGMEVSILVLLMSVCVWLTLQSMEDHKFRPWLYVLLTVGTFVRPDMVVPFAGMVAFLAFFEISNRWKNLLWGAALIAASWTAQLLFRLWYFGDPLPNTYYLKLTGYPATLRIFKGALMLAQFMWNANLLLFAVPFALLFLKDRRIRLLLWVLVVQMAYSAYVGGDAWENWGGSNRYISIAMPGFFILLSYGLFLFTRRFVRSVFEGEFWSKPRTSLASFGMLVAYSVFSVNSIHGVGALAELTLLQPPLLSGEDGENQGDVKNAILFDTITTPDATLAVVRGGTVPYYSRRPVIDMLGKVDRHIAHEPMHRLTSGLHRFIEFRPGHMKYDYDYSIGEEAPDVIVHLWDHREWVRPYLNAYYTGFRVQDDCVFFRKGSSRILWGRMSAMKPCVE